MHLFHRTLIYFSTIDDCVQHAFVGKYQREIVRQMIITSAESTIQSLGYFLYSETGCWCRITWIDQSGEIKVIRDGDVTFALIKQSQVVTTASSPSPLSIE